MADNFQGDLAAVARIDAVPTILEVVCRTTGMGFAAVARVTEERWIACAVRDEISFGLKPGGELKVETTICNEIRASGEARRHRPCRRGRGLLRPPDAGDVRLSELHLDADRPARRRLLRHAVRHRPAAGEPEDGRRSSSMFRLFADLIAFHLDADESDWRRARRRSSTSARRRSCASSSSPCSATICATRSPRSTPACACSQKETLGGRAPAIVRLVQSSVSRMAELIDNVLDFARGRLGGGLKLDLNAEARLRPVLEQVVAELRSAWPERAIETALVIDQPVNCDRARIAQLLSNLLGNALTHGAPDAPVRVSASSDGDVFELSVENKGEPIPPGTVDRLFQPFFRGAGPTGQQGLGLGLYIASEIARAHGGTLTVASSPERTRFTLRMPRGDAPREGASARGKEELQSGVV